MEVHFKLLLSVLSFFWHQDNLISEIYLTWFGLCFFFSLLLVRTKFSVADFYLRYAVSVLTASSESVQWDDLIFFSDLRLLIRNVFSLFERQSKELIYNLIHCGQNYFCFNVVECFVYKTRYCMEYYKCLLNKLCRILLCICVLWFKLWRNFLFFGSYFKQIWEYGVNCWWCFTSPYELSQGYGECLNIFISIVLFNTHVWCFQFLWHLGQLKGAVCVRLAIYQTFGV